MDRSRTPPLRNTNNSRADVGTTPLSNILRQARTRRRAQSAQTDRGRSRIHGRGLFFCLSRILNQCNVTQKLERASPQKLVQSNLHRKAASKRFSKVKNFEFEFPTIFRLHNGNFKFSNFENRFFERRIPQRTDQVPWSYSGLA